MLIIVLFGVIIYFKYLQRKDTAVLENSVEGGKLVANSATIYIRIINDIYIDHKENEYQTAAYTEVTDAIYDTVDPEQASCVI